MPNPNILPLPFDAPFVTCFSKWKEGDKSMRRIAFSCGEIAFAWTALADDAIAKHGLNCGHCFLLGTVTQLKARGYTKEQVLEAMESR